MRNTREVQVLEFLTKSGQPKSTQEIAIALRVHSTANCTGSKLVAGSLSALHRKGLVRNIDSNLWQAC